MISRLTKTVTIVAVTTPLLMATLSGCVWRSKETVERETGAPVVMAPPPASDPVVMSPGPAAPPPTGVACQIDRVMYQEGRWQLFGDGKEHAVLLGVGPGWFQLDGDPGTAGSPERRSGAIGRHLSGGSLAALR
jgi:hypothetical protein